MTSSSASSVHKSFKYDVFLSFRGEDTRTNFVDHLYNALRAKNIQTYKDDEEINKGKRITDELIGSIKDSKFYIIVFSKNYASSSWCLDELVTIMECQKTVEHTAYPIFYGVEPTEVRNQNGAVGEAFAKHENKEDAEKWRKALQEAASLAGWDLNTDRYEAKLIQNIVEVLSLELRSINFSIDEKLIGMETRINDVISFLGTGSDDVRMLGIKGIGGGGKTTLARALFDQISFKFEGKSFVENVREASNPSLSGLKWLQNQVLKDVLNDQQIEINSVSEGKNMMKRRMHDRTVLLVLDDVDCLEQLEALAEPNWFKPGSRIIITTRDEQVLISHRVKLIRDVNLLSGEEAICLFSRYAFGREIPIQGYAILSRQVVNYAAGLPLTIRVLGSFLCGKNELEWMDAIKRLKTVPLKETQKKLELSYDSLEQDYKEIFLDVACILKGHRKDKAIKALECCGFHARNGLRVLEQRSLITIYHSGYFDLHGEYLGMHDHIEEMGKNIVRRSHPGKPNKHSRLWISKEIEEILANDKGTRETECIRLHTWELNPEIAMKGFRNMKELRYLDVSFGFFRKLNKAGKYFPNALRYLVWSNYPFRSLPKTFHADNLVALEMVHSNIVQLWEGGERKVLNKLRFVDLRHSMLTTFDLGLTPNLEILTLEGCGHLVELHTFAGCLKLKSVDLKGSNLRSLDLRSALNLEVLDLENCLDLVDLYMPHRSLNLRSLKLSHSKLRTLDIGLAPNLELLHLEECKNLVELLMSSSCLNLRSLTITKSKLRTLDIGLASNIELLHLEECKNLVELLMSSSCLNLRSLTITKSKLRTLDIGLASNIELLHLEECKNLVELLMSSSCLNLISLTLTKSKLRTLDIGLTPNLEYLNLESCYDLEELHMAHECQKLSTLNISHSKLKTLDLGLTPNLKKLDLKKCYDLVELYPPIECLKRLVYLDLGLRFRSFLFHKKDNTCRSVDESLEVVSLAEVNLIAESIETCPFHPDNNSPKYQFICFWRQDLVLFSRYVEKLFSVALCACTILETFSGSIHGLGRIKSLTLEGYPEVPKGLDQLECLEELVLSSSKTKNLRDSIHMPKHLKFLQLESCWLLERLPENLDLLKCLEKLILKDCILLGDIPESISNMKCLQVLYMENTRISQLPQSISLLKGLRIYGPRGILQSCGTTSEILPSECHMYCYVDV